MAASSVSQLQRQITCVSRRLFVQALLDTLLWFWAGALILAACWCLFEPHLVTDAPLWLRWAVAGGLIGGGPIAGILFVILGRPTVLDTALSLDERFGLKERITTSVSLTAAERESSAGAALLADVETHIAKLDIRSRYPFTLRWTVALLPVSGGLLTLAPPLYHPQPGQATPADDQSQPLANAAQVEQKMKKLEKKPREQKKAERATPEQIQQFEDDMDKLTVRPRNNRKEAQDVVKEATALEEKMMNHQRGLVDKNQA